MEGRIASMARLREANPSKKTYLVKFLTWHRDIYEWDRIKIEAKTDREACLLALAILDYGTDDLSELAGVRDLTGEYVMDLPNSDLLNRLREINAELGVYYMKNLTTGQVLIDDTADYRDFCGEHFEANTDQSIVLWDED